MEITLKVEKTYNAEYLEVKANVRYWEDGTVNGVKDEDGKLTPCRDGDSWCPIIHIDTGIIENWKFGKVAYIHYKVCDDGVYRLLDKEMNLIKEYDGYVPSDLAPDGEGYGDYIILNIDKTGQIENWNPTLSEFLETEGD